MQDETFQWVATSGLIFNQNGQFLIVRRAAHDSHPNLWELPGGAMDHGEHPKQAVAREIKEETGLNITVHFPISTSYVFSTKSPELQVVRIAFLCKLTTPNQDVLLSSEHSAYQWVQSLDDIEGEISDFLEEIISDITKYNLPIKF